MCDGIEGGLGFSDLGLGLMGFTKKMIFWYGGR